MLSPCRTISRCAQDLGLDRLVLGVRNELRGQHLARLLEALHHVAPGASDPARRAGAGDLHATGAGAQLLDLADAPLLSPRLILGLADAIHALRLGGVETRVDEDAITGLRAGQIA